MALPINRVAKTLEQLSAARHINTVRDAAYKQTAKYLVKLLRGAAYKLTAKDLDIITTLYRRDIMSCLQWALIVRDVNLRITLTLTLKVISNAILSLRKYDFHVVLSRSLTAKIVIARSPVTLCRILFCLFCQFMHF